jgi:protein-S-isoprenylcysteine O-methyltransferase Ste14
MRTLFVTVRTLIYGTAFLSFFGWLAFRVRTFDRSFGWSLPAGTAIPGILLVLVGGIIGLSCIWVFVVRGRGTPAPFDPPREFVAVGPYKYSRNPMYIGGLCLLGGLGLYERSISILIMVLVLFAVVHLVVILYEEPVLERNFDGSYQDYCRQVGRWIPRLRPSR